MCFLENNILQNVPHLCCAYEKKHYEKWMFVHISKGAAVDSFYHFYFITIYTCFALYICFVQINFNNYIFPTLPLSNLQINNGIISIEYWLVVNTLEVYKVKLQRVFIVFNYKPISYFIHFSIGCLHINFFLFFFWRSVRNSLNTSIRCYPAEEIKSCKWFWSLMAIKKMLHLRLLNIGRYTA